MVAITVMMAVVIMLLIARFIPNGKSILPSQMGGLGVSTSADGRYYLVEVVRDPSYGELPSVSLASWAVISDHGIAIDQGLVSEVYMANMGYDGDSDGVPDIQVSFQDRDAALGGGRGMAILNTGDAFWVLKEAEGGPGSDGSTFRVMYPLDGHSQLVYKPVEFR